jgi:hypothetical protein
VANFLVDAYNADRTEIEQQFSLTPKDATAAALAPLSATSPVGSITSGALPTVRVPAGWYLKVTVSRMAITSTTYA